MPTNTVPAILTVKAPSMTRQHFNFLAAAMRDAAPPIDDGPARNTWVRTCARLSCDLERTNKNFNGDRFLAACGVGEA